MVNAGISIILKQFDVFYHLEWKSINIKYAWVNHIGRYSVP